MNNNLGGGSSYTELLENLYINPYTGEGASYPYWEEADDE